MGDITYSVQVDWNNDGDYADAGETITSRVLGSGAIQFDYGRDAARSLSAVTPGETSFLVNNESGDYSPENGSSPLAGNLVPGRPVLVQATHNAVTYDMFRGFLDGYELEPGGTHAVNKVKFACMDMLSKLAEAKMSTGLYESVQTGEALGILLDQIGWSATARDIDAGATTVRWWWEEGTSGLEALQKIVEAEGPPAFAFVGADGDFVFRDRHHRLLRAASTAVQATFRAGITEPMFSDLGYDIGWKDLVNQVTIDVQEREPVAEARVWESEEGFTLAAGESRTIFAQAGEPFLGAVTPVSGTDFTLVSGAVNVVISRESGQSTNIIVTATSASVIQGMALRAVSVPVARTHHIVVEDTASIDKYGVRTLQDTEINYAGKNDAFAIAQVILGHRAERRPVVHITIKNGNDTRKVQMLTRDLSDLVHIIEASDTFLDDDFFIEHISHEIGSAGKAHSTTFGCEKAFKNTADAPNYFTFDVAGKGFNQGVFTDAGNMLGDEVFILDSATNGELGVNALGF